MNFLKKLFRQRTPEQKRQRAILNRWRQQQDIRLPWLTIPNPANLHLWLFRQHNRRRRLAVIAAAERSAWMACQRAARRQRRRTARPTRSANAWRVLKRKWRHCRRFCRVLRHRLLVKLLRWLAVHLICLLLLLVWCLVPWWLPRLCLWLGQKKSSPAPSSC